MTSPIPSPLPEGWRAVTARTQAECDAVEPCGDRVILVLTPSEAITVHFFDWYYKCSACGDTGLAWFDPEGCKALCDSYGTCDGVLTPLAISHNTRWLIVQGGESPCHPDWVRSLQKQAEAAGVPFWFVGWGDFGVGAEAHPMYETRWVLGHAFERVGPSRSGRLLDGQEWSQVPEELQR